MKKITIEDILEKKKINKKHKMSFESEVLGGIIDFEKIDPSKVIDLLQDAKEGKITIHNANLYLIYLSVPMFRNQKLMEESGIKDSPYKIVEEILQNNVMEITAFADYILLIYGFEAEKVEKLKK